MTLLFADEWKSGNWWVHAETKNSSFIRYSALLKKMGVKNYLWPLQLPDPRLRHIDPHDPNLTPEQQELVALGCKKSLIYFVREVVRVPGSDPDNPTRFIANRANMALFWSYLNHVALMLIQPRQTGKSFSTDVLNTWLMNFRYRKRQILLLTKDDKLRTANLQRMKDLEAELPWYLRMRLSNDVGNTEELKISRLGNHYLGLLPANSPKDANNVGRGMTAPTFQFDEAAFFRYIYISAPAALAAGTAARDSAEAKGEPYGTIFTTTAGELDEPEGRWAYNWLSAGAVWNECLFDCANEQELNLMIRANSRIERDHLNPDGVIRLNLTFNHRQLGYSDAWLARKISEAGAEGDGARRDFLNEWTRGNASSPLSKEQLAMINESLVTRMFASADTGFPYMLRWYIPLEEREAYIETNGAVMSLDTSDAVGRDDIGLHIRCVRTGETIAAGNFNETNLITFASWLVELITHYPKLYTIIERRSSGIAILDYLLLMLPARGIDPFKRLYNTVVQDYNKDSLVAKELARPVQYRSTRLYDEYKAAFGFATSGSGATSRDNLFGNTLQQAVNVTGKQVRDDMLIKQIAGLVTRNGRIDHRAGGHDDLCVAWLLSYWFLTQGRNLQMYGIRPMDVLSLNVIVRTENAPDKVNERMRIAGLMREVREITDRLTEENNEYMVIRLEARLKVLMPQIPKSETMATTYEQLVESLREQRKARRRTQAVSRRAA